jgi:hypothetical protein
MNLQVMAVHGIAADPNCSDTKQNTQFQQGGMCLQSYFNKLAPNPTSQQSERMRPEQREFSEQKQREFRGSGSGMGSGITPNPDSGKRYERWMHTLEPEAAKRHISPRNARSYQRPTWENFPTQPPVCGRNDGLSPELVGITVSKHRNESIKAYGNAIVPQVAFQIFKAIEAMEQNLAMQ